MKFSGLSVMTLASFASVVACGPKHHDRAPAHPQTRPVVVTRVNGVNLTPAQAQALAQQQRLVQIGEFKSKMAQFKVLYKEYNDLYAANPQPNAKDLIAARAALTKLSALHREIQTSPLVEEADKKTMVDTAIKLEIWKAALTP